MFHKFLIIFLILTFSSNSFASQMPRFLGSEKKFRSYVYNPNDVYRYIGHYTYQGFIEFAEGETISTISMGDPTLWLFEHLGNRLFLKPVGEDNSETNMTVITNLKVYHFELMAKEAKGINDKDLIFVVRFLYPEEKDKNIVQFPKKPTSDEPDMRDLSIYNFAYQYTGENSIAPIKVFDNGEFTYFKFSNKNAEIPAIFSVDANGYESLVNFRSTGDYIIVERVSKQYTLRSGSDIVCVYNSGMYRGNSGGNIGLDGNSLIPQSKVSQFSYSNNSPQSDSLPQTPMQNPYPDFMAPGFSPNENILNPNMPNQNALPPSFSTPSTFNPSRGI